MKKVLVFLSILFAPTLFAQSTASSHSASHQRYEICFHDGQYKILQPNMCYALGGERKG